MKTAAELHAALFDAQVSLASIRGAAQAVVSMRHADDVAFRAAVNVLVTQVLGPGAFDGGAKAEGETAPEQCSWVGDERRYGVFNCCIKEAGHDGAHETHGERELRKSGLVTP